jgi:hypothetical protein
VAPAFGSIWRRQGEHSLDPKRYLRCDLGDYDFTIYSCMPRQLNEACVFNSIHINVRSRLPARMNCRADSRHIGAIHPRVKWQMQIAVLDRIHVWKIVSAPAEYGVSIIAIMDLA